MSWPTVRAQPAGDFQTYQSVGTRWPRFAQPRGAAPSCRLEAERLKEAADWIEHYRRFRSESFDRLDDYLKELQAKPGAKNE